jgi:hypothetical protein
MSTTETVRRKGNRSRVIAGKNYYNPGRALCEITNTGNGYIVKFPPHNCVTQDYYVCLDYAQASDMILGFSAFKEELGFK